MDRERIEATQKKMLKRVHDTEETSSVREVTGILRSIQSYEKEEVLYAMDDFGGRLQEFAKHIDLSHPDLPSIFAGQLVGTRDCTFSRDASDLLKMVTEGRKWKMSKNVIDSLKRVIKTHDCYKPLKTNIDDPQNNLQYVRFVKDELERRFCRSRKHSLPMPLVVLYKKTDEFWSDVPEDFSLYMRGCSVCADDIKIAMKRKKHFDDHSLHSMADNIQNSIEEMKKFASENSYCKFNRISLTMVAAIAAKMMGYVREPYSQIYSETRWVINAEPECFGNYKFCDLSPEDQWFCDHMRYTPRLYTTWELPIPPQMEELLSLLDAYPEMGCKPLFDHLRVFVPGAAYPNTVSEFAPEDIVPKSVKETDIALMDKGLLIPVLLGERDGDHYFVSYWM